MTHDPATPVSPWPHRWAVLTVCATVVLLLVGAKVTTLKVGMVDKEWPTHPLHLFFQSRTDAGFVIEHSHRLAGYVVGLCTIVMVVIFWMREPRRWVRWLAAAALLCVIVQGLLGGFRVLLNAILGTDLATLHGCVAQLVFALLVAIAVVTSRGWREGPSIDSCRLRNLTLWVCGLVYGQIVLGALVRHSDVAVARRLHLLFAFVAAGSLLWLVFRTWTEARSDRRMSRTASHLLGFLAVQLVLGVEAWMNRFAPGVPLEDRQVTIASGMVQTLHFVFGSLVFAGTVTMALWAHQPRSALLSVSLPPSETLEGAA